MSLRASSVLRFFNEIGGDINECDFLILYNKMCNLLESPHSSVSLYFPNDQCMILQNHAGVKDPFKVQDKPMDFNIMNMRSPLVDFRFHTAT